ncbi:SsrA-binding protein [Wandonia haliotis]|uniref:SsrA-binding protein n=1 Tax=Wandonia haliotis TaxID=574963 RepID=A0ABN1MN04_9FLAO
MSQSGVNIRNKRANFEYQIIEKFVAGIQLTGTEIKSIRNSKASIVEAYCVFEKEELFIRNMHIAEYENGSYYNHNPRRDRKLLLNRRELDKLFKKSKVKGFSIIPLNLFINEKGLAKLNIALGQGKKLHDKREDLKAKDSKRDMDRAMKSH